MHNESAYFLSLLSPASVNTLLQFVDMISKLVKVIILSLEMRSVKRQTLSESAVETVPWKHPFG